jgi:hypothetical protein
MITRKTLTLILAFLLSTVSGFAQKTKDDENNVARIVDLYIQIKNALVNDDGVTAEMRANDLHRLLTQHPDKGLSRIQARALADNFGPLIENSREMSSTSYENEQRHYLAKLTLSLYELVKAVRMNTPKLYLQYCPLNKSYWLSETEVIKNPYYNYREFTSIGKTTEVLAAN